MSNAVDNDSHMGERSYERSGPNIGDKMYPTSRVELDQSYDELTLWGEFHSPERTAPLIINRPYESYPHSNF